MTVESDDTQRARDGLIAVVKSTVAPRDRRVLDALRRVPRHEFVPEPERSFAYQDRALPIGEGQTISQPSMIAVMLDTLACTPHSRVLEVGAGCGYAAALLSCLAAEVDAVEIRPALAERARATLAALGIENVRIHVADGSRGLPERAPFDRILVSAAPETVPPALVEQLALGGRIAIPVGDSWGQTLLVGHKDAVGLVTWHRDIPCMFVPLVRT